MKSQLETAFITQHEDGHFSTYTDIIIDVPKNLVWEILSDFENMKNWSTSLVNVTGNIQDGGKVQSHFSFANKIWLADHTFTFQEGDYFGWSDPLSDDFEGVQDNHLFKLEAISENRTKFIQSDEFTGKNAVLHGLTLARISFDNYLKFNRELYSEVEKRANKID